MSNLSGIFYIIIGLGVTLISFGVNSSQNSSKLSLFILIGIGMTVYGFWQQFIDKSITQPLPRYQHNTRKPNPRPPFQQHMIHEKGNYGIQEQVQFQPCFACGAPAPVNYQFCPRCRTRLR